MGAACATETLSLPLAIAQRQDELCHRLDRLNLSESLAQEAARRARLQALAFDQMLSLPELSRQLCLFWGLKTSRAFAALARSSGSRA